MRIYTKTGDKGFTSLLGGQRVIKTDIQINAYGTVDELNSYVGLLKDQNINKKRLCPLGHIQKCLFTIGTILSIGTTHQKIKIPQLKEEDVELLEKEIDDMQETLPVLTSFILPGGHVSVSFGHIARTVCRRAERVVIELNSDKKISPHVVKYLNRLSDYFFVLCRKMTQELGLKEMFWIHKK